MKKNLGDFSEKKYLILISFVPWRQPTVSTDRALSSTHWRQSPFVSTRDRKCFLFLKRAILPGALKARALLRPGSCVLYSLALSACWGGGEHHNYSCMRRERIEFIHSREDGPFSSLSLFYDCRQCCLLSSDGRGSLLTTPPSLPSYGRQEGTSVVSRLAPLLLVSSRRHFRFEHVERSLHMSMPLPRYGYVSLGSQFRHHVHHRACCHYLFWQLSVVSTFLFWSA